MAKIIWIAQYILKMRFFNTIIKYLEKVSIKLQNQKLIQNVCFLNFSEQSTICNFVRQSLTITFPVDLVPLHD